MQNELKDMKKISFVSDGWTNVSGNHLINFVADIPGHPAYFLNVSDAKLEKMTGEILLRSQKKKLLRSIVTDNAPNMQVAWRIIERDHPHICCNGCGSHTESLLLKDACEISRVAAVLNKAQELTHFVKDRSSVLEKFKQIQVEMKNYGVIHLQCGLCHISETRFGYHERCLRHVMDNSKELESLTARIK